MAYLNKIQVSGDTYELAAKYDETGKEIASTYASQEALDKKIEDLIGAAPETLDTLTELADALGKDPNFATTIATQLGLKVDKEEGKGLSTEDFTTALKEVLEKLPDEVKAKYTKPSTGIPKTDLSSDIQASLGKADSAVQDISGKLDKTTYDTDKVTFALKSQIPTTLPASDVSAWAKAATKPTYTAAEVGLDNVNNTSDINKPISTATQTALNNKVDKADGKSLVSDTEITKLAGLSSQEDIDGAINKVQTNLNTHTSNKENPHEVTKAQVGLDKVDNTSDKDKPISDATQDALDKKADKTNLDTLVTDVASLTKSVDNIQGLEELFSYGVQWEDGVANPELTRIGNPLLHKSLPIQSSYKGCVAKKNVIQYYLDPNDWSKKADGTESVLDGTDGDVCVHTPKFYGKSGSEGTTHWVRISTFKVDASWVEIPEMLVDAYRSTTYTIDNVTYTASVVNTSTDYRGGSRRTNYDTYLETDPFRTDLGKPRTSVSRGTMRPFAVNAGGELLCYEYYKWIFYWNYVIEYANFNAQAAYKADLTSDGYRQGGLGDGITNMGNWSEYNGCNPLTPCGYGNDLGNFTGVKDLVIPAFDYTKNSIWFNSMAVNNSTCTSSNSTNNSKLVTAVKSIDNYAFYHNPDNIWGTYTYVISGLTDDQSIIFKEGSSYATAETKLTVTEDGTYTVDWADYNTGGQKWVSFGKVQDSCNIKIYNLSVNPTTITRASQTLKMPRWRGFDNPFGDIWTILDGIVLKRDASGQPSNVYTSTTDFTDTIGNKQIAGIEVAQDGYIKSFDLGETGNIIPSQVGGNQTTYMCDYHWCNSSSTESRCLLVGGSAANGSDSGPGYFHSGSGVGSSDSHCGVRTIKKL